MHDTAAARLERQQTALLEISRRWRWYEADLDKAVQAVVEAAARALDVQRASVWFLSENRDAIVCHDLYEAPANRHTRGTTLYEKTFRPYFDALRSEEVIAADDAHNDPRTTAFTEPYLKPLGIGAMLDAPIRFGGRLVGVLCNEHVGGPRHFTADEQNTASYLANLLSLAYEFQRRAESEMERERALSLLRAAFEATGAGILAVDLDGRVNAHNQRLLEMWNLTPELMGTAGDHGGRMAHIARQGKHPERVAARYLEIKANPEMESLDVEELVDGRSIECVSRPQRLDGAVVGRVWSFRDVTYQRRIEAELRELAFRDALTGLYNRRRAEETLEQEVARVLRTGQPLTVALLDIDHFKLVNDHFGHQVGDDVLRQLGHDLKKRLRGTDIACRWGGEEFLVILPYTNRAGALQVIDELRRYIGRERKALPQFTLSAGVAEHDGKDRRWDAVVKLADGRLYQAKQQGRNQVV